MLPFLNYVSVPFDDMKACRQTQRSGSPLSDGAIGGESNESKQKQLKQGKNLGSGVAETL